MRASSPFLRDQYVVGLGADTADGGALYLAFFRPKVPYGDMLQGREKGLVHLLHEIFYLLIFVVLLSGFLMLEHGFAVFGAIDFPRPIANLEVNRFFFAVHRYSCIALSAMIVLHIAAVIKHHCFARRAILRRML
ncbi:cytochrome b [Serratia ureilytica]